MGNSGFTRREFLRGGGLAFGRGWLSRWARGAEVLAGHKAGGR